MLAVHGSSVIPLDQHPYCIPFQLFQPPEVIHPMSAIIEKMIFSQNFMHADVNKQQTELNNLFQWELLAFLNVYGLETPSFFVL